MLNPLWTALHGCLNDLDSRLVAQFHDGFYARRMRRALTGSPYTDPGRMFPLLGDFNLGAELFDRQLRLVREMRDKCR